MPAVVAAVRANPKNAPIAKQACSALWNMAAGPPEACASIGEVGVRCAVEAIAAHAETSVGVAEDAAGALLHMANDETLRAHVMEVGGVEACCNVLRRHVKTPSACQNACGALGRLLTTPQSVDRVCACGAVQLTVACMQTSPRDLDLIDEAAFLLTALVGRMAREFVKRAADGTGGERAGGGDSSGGGDSLVSSLERGHACGLVDAAVGAVDTVVSIGSVQPSFDVERLYQPCKLLANLCLVSLPSYQAALLKPATASTLVGAFQMMWHLVLKDGQAQRHAADKPEEGVETAATQALVSFKRCGPEFERMLLATEGIKQVTKELIEHGTSRVEEVLVC